jgi:hypothetical protein
MDPRGTRERSAKMRSIVAALGFAGMLGCTRTAPMPVLPENAVDFIISAFQSRPIVALDHVEGDGNQSEAELIEALLASPRLDHRIDDVVIESGNSLYQNVLGLKLQNLFDACLFLGMPASLKSIDLRDPADPGFAKELARRRAIMSGAAP